VSCVLVGVCTNVCNLHLILSPTIWYEIKSALSNVAVNNWRWKKIVRSQLCLLIEILLNEALRKRNSIDTSIRVFYDTIIDRKLNVVKSGSGGVARAQKFILAPPRLVRPVVMSSINNLYRSTHWIMCNIGCFSCTSWDLATRWKSPEPRDSN
jgi:hypothetical protein